MADDTNGSGPALPPKLDLRKSGILKDKMPQASIAPVQPESSAKEVAAAAAPSFRPVDVPLTAIRPIPAAPTGALPRPASPASAPAGASVAAPVAGGIRPAMSRPVVPAAPFMPVSPGGATVTPVRPPMPGMLGGVRPAGVLTAQRPGIVPAAVTSAKATPTAKIPGAAVPAPSTIRITRPMLKVETPAPVEEASAPAAVTDKPANDESTVEASSRTVMINMIPDEPDVAKTKAPAAEQSTIKLVRKTLPGLAKPVQSGVPTAVPAKKETSKISLEQAVPSAGPVNAVPDGKATGLPLMKKPMMNMSTVSNALSNAQSQEAILTDKRKTSRISLEAVLAAETSEVKKNPSAPTTIRLKKPTDSAGIKIGAAATPPEVASSTVALSQTAKLDEAAESSPTATRKKTIKIKKPGGGTSLDFGGSESDKGVSGLGGPAHISHGTPVVTEKEGKGSKIFSVISLVLTSAAIVVTIVTIFIFNSQLAGLNY